MIRVPRLIVTGQGKSLGFRGLGRVVVFLAFLQGAGVGREEMAAYLWPGEEESVAANRLRVSLNRIRGLLGDSLVVDRQSVRLLQSAVTVDLFEEEAALREVLDEVDLDQQYQLLAAHSEAIRSTAWRDFLELDPFGSLRSWDSVCRAGLKRMVETAHLQQDWAGVDLVWELMRARGDFDAVIVERFLEAHYARQTLDEGFRTLRRAAEESKLDLDGALFLGLKSQWQKLKESASPGPFQTRHHQLLGKALLEGLEPRAEALAQLLAEHPVQVQMQAAPADYLEIMEEIQRYLPVGEPAWVGLETARLGVYGTLYDAPKVLEISAGLLRCTLTPLQATSTWFHYAFILFQLRRWDEAFNAIRSGQTIAKTSGLEGRYEVGRLTEAAFLWHLGEVSEAQPIYDSFLGRFASTDDFLLGVNWAITQTNYVVIELVFGDVREARRRADLAYAERKRFNLARLMPNLLSTMGLAYGRTGDLHQGIDYAIESLKMTFWRGSSREGHLNMEWACGLLVLAGLREEAWNVMAWVNAWRIRTEHTRSVCEVRYYESLGLSKFEGGEPQLPETTEYRQMMRFLIKCLRRAQRPSDRPSG